MGKQKLFTDFPPVSTEAWEAVIKSDLRGADYDKKLVWKSQEGFPVKPYYRAENLTNKTIRDSKPGVFPYLRGNKSRENTWEIRFSIEVKDIEEANKKALYFLNRGVTSLAFIFNPDFFTHSKPNKELISKLFEGIYIDCIEIHFDAGIHSLGLLRLFGEYAESSGFDPLTIKGSLSFDPFNHLIHTGKFYLNEAADFGLCTDNAMHCLSRIPHFRPISINTSIFGDAGALITQEIAFALAAGSEYLELLSIGRITVDNILRSIHFTMSAGSDFFTEIARLRAFRFLWAKLAEAWNPQNKENCFANIHSVSSNWNQSIYDAHVNLLRNTTSAMSAILGGADSIEVRPFDSVFRLSNEFSERLALNTQLILKEEAWLDKVTDPAAGSYYIETLTESIIQQCWKLFLEIESQGGYLASIKKGLISEMVETTANTRIANVSSRREIILGSNQYPNFTESINSLIEKEVPGSLSSEDKSGIALDIRRASSEIELLRLKSENQPHRPKVFMLTIGNPVMRLARANFSCNFFACGGFEVMDNIGFESVEAAVGSVVQNEPDIVVVCSSDEEYAEIVPRIYRELSSIYTGKTKTPVLVVAGAPACMDELKSKGIDHFINVRSNLVQTLIAYQSELGILD